MRVKCIKIVNEHTQENQTESPWLTIGKEYIVLETLMSAKKGLRYRMVGDNKDKSPSVFSASQFEVITDLIPSNWQINMVNKSLIILGPQSWRQNEFWDNCYDQQQAALEIYKREARIIMEEEGEL